MQNQNDVLADVKLLFNMNHVNYDDAYQEGYDQAQKNITEATNPYPRNSKANRYWREGWWDGFYSVESMLDEAAESEQAEATVILDKPSFTNEVYRFLVFIFELMCVSFGALLAFTLYDLSF